VSSQRKGKNREVTDGTAGAVSVDGEVGFLKHLDSTYLVGTPWTAEPEEDD
jgi:hypothetical protein